jgi:hypothetical protein
MAILSLAYKTKIVFVFVSHGLAPFQIFTRKRRGGQQQQRSKELYKSKDLFYHRFDENLKSIKYFRCVSPEHQSTDTLANGGEVRVMTTMNIGGRQFFTESRRWMYEEEEMNTMLLKKRIENRKTNIR